MSQTLAAVALLSRVQQAANESNRFGYCGAQMGSALRRLMASALLNR